MLLTIGVICIKYQSSIANCGTNMVKSKSMEEISVMKRHPDHDSNAFHAQKHHCLGIADSRQALFCIWKMALLLINQYQPAFAYSLIKMNLILILLNQLLKIGIKTRALLVAFSIKWKHQQRAMAQEISFLNIIEKHPEKASQLTNLLNTKRANNASQMYKHMTIKVDLGPLHLPSTPTSNE